MNPALKKKLKTALLAEDEGALSDLRRFLERRQKQEESHALVVDISGETMAFQMTTKDIQNRKDIDLPAVFLIPESALSEEDRKDLVLLQGKSTLEDDIFQDKSLVAARLRMEASLWRTYSDPEETFRERDLETSGLSAETLFRYLGRWGQYAVSLQDLLDLGSKHIESVTIVELWE